MKKTILICTIFVVVICLVRCNNAVNSGGFAPVAFPTNLGIPGFIFPTDSQNIDAWLTLEQTDSIRALDSIYNHGWGIWAGLTIKTTDTIPSNDTLLVFETWDSPGFLQNLLNNTPGASAGTAHMKTIRNSLRIPNQLKHIKRINVINFQGTPFIKIFHGPSNCPQTSYSKGIYPLLVTVEYNGPAAGHILNNKLFDTSALNTILSTGVDSIPDFPNNSIAIKPTYEIIPKSAIQSGKTPFRIWTGPNFCQSGYGQNVWGGLVYIDGTNQEHTNNSGIDSSGNTGPNNTNTYNLNQFIYYVLTAADADSANANFGVTIAHAGDYAVLVGMHVTTREIERWTWQSFFWTPDINMPATPSDSYIASRRPAQITGAPAHYAMAIGYTFSWPNQPYTGGNISGNVVYAYNPFLEAGFGTAIFDASGSATLVNPKNTADTTINLVGCASNCMSCHALSTYTSSASPFGQPNPYIADTYVDMLTNANFKDPLSKFSQKKKLKLDFLWSIDDNLLAR